MTELNQEKFEREIYRYCEIVYQMLQANPELYDELMPKSTFKLISDKEETSNEQIKIAA